MANPGVRCVSRYTSDTMWIFRFLLYGKEFHVMMTAMDDGAVDLSFSTLVYGGASLRSLRSLFNEVIYNLVLELFQSLELFRDKHLPVYKIKVNDISNRRVKIYKKNFARNKERFREDLRNSFFLRNLSVTNNSLEIFIQRT